MAHAVTTLVPMMVYKRFYFISFIFLFDAISVVTNKMQLHELLGKLRTTTTTKIKILNIYMGAGEVNKAFGQASGSRCQI